MAANSTSSIQFSDVTVDDCIVWKVHGKPATVWASPRDYVFPKDEDKPTTVDWYFQNKEGDNPFERRWFTKNGRISKEGQRFIDHHNFRKEYIRSHGKVPVFDLFGNLVTEEVDLNTKESDDSEEEITEISFKEFKTKNGKRKYEHVYKKTNKKSRH